MRLLLTRDTQGPDVRALRAALAQTLGAAAADYPGLAQGDAFDAATEAALRRWQAGVGLLADGVAGPRCLALLGLLSLPEPAYPMQLASVRPLFPATKPANVERYLPYVSAALCALGLQDRPLLLGALGTIRAETEGFVPISELPSQFNTLPGQPPFSAYEQGTGPGGRVGNTEAGDGARYKGRGFVQLTGRDNYARYGKALGLPLLQQPDLANTPEVAALLLARFLVDKAPAMRTALKANDRKQARKLVNGGSHGLSRFESVFDLAAQTVPALAGASRRKAKKSDTALTPPLTARADTPDLRDRPYLPPPANLHDAFPPDALVAEWLPRYTRAGLILDQGQEGACTGFGLAAVVNFLRWRKAGYPAKLTGVSPRMLYTLARRYDEYAGEDYEGSSCRGALKGWFHHGVCSGDDWPYAEPNPRFGYAERAAETSLGVYFRVSLTSITDLQAAIQEVGAVFVSAYTHAGWGGMKRAKAKAPKGHADLPVIDWDGQISTDNGHSFALVGFNREGFVIQNSWGPDWGCGGFAVLRYDDWLANAMDAWVAALGVAGVVAGRVRQAGAPAAKKKASSARWWDTEQAYRHSIVLGDDGRVRRYLTEDESTRTLLHQAAGLPDQWFRSGAGQSEKKKRLLLYVHGGLNSEKDALKRARALGRYATGNGCYPLFVVWKTGLMETLGNILRPRGISDVTDRLIEDGLGRTLVRPVWSEMKGNAELAFEASRGGHHLAKALIQLGRSWGSDFELHLVGHSAGAIWLGHLLSQLAREGASGLASSVHLYAPACSIAFANRHYSPQQRLMKQLHLDVLSEEAERDDSTVQIYRKSLLYLVSNALEPDRRTPLLGLARAHDAADAGWEGSSATQEALRAWREAGKVAGLYGKSGRYRETGAPFSAAAGVSERASHGGFDNDRDTVTRTLLRITGAAQLALPVDDLRGFLSMGTLLRFLRWLAGITLLVYGLLLIAIWAGQRNLLYHPDANLLTQGEAIGAQTLQLQSADGERLVAWWLKPPDASAPVVLYLHGNGANLDARDARIAALHEDGAGVLALSWRGYGGSTGSPSESGWAQDADAAYAWLRAQDIAPARIVLFGESLGSTHAVMLAARQPPGQQPGALLLDSSFDSAVALAQGHYPLIPVRWLMRDPHRADIAASQLRLPVLQVHCARDPVAPLAHAQALNRLFGAKAELVVIDDNCHVPSYARYREAGRAFIGRLRDAAR